MAELSSKIDANNIEGYVWFWKAQLPERSGQPVTIVTRNGNSLLLRFADGHTVIAHRYAIRRADSWALGKKNRKTK